MRSNEVKDLTQGNVFKLILGFSITTAVRNVISTIL